MNTIARILQVRASRNGLSIDFNQEPDGLWVATWRTGRRSQALAGSLISMWRLANNVI